MTITLVDADARNRIATALGESLLVEAGAGTGKTTVLVARLVEVLRTGHATIDELVVITFTEKAATELAARVREQLEETIRATTSDEERARLDAALRGLYRARIETIHAFAASLLRERPVESPVDPGLRVLDGIASSVLFDDEYDAWLQEALAEHADILGRAVRRGFQTTHLRQLAEVLHDQRAALPAELAAADEPDLAVFLVAASGAADTLRAQLSECTKPDEDRAFTQAETLIAWVDALLAQADDPQEVERRVLFRAVSPKARAGQKGNWSSDEALAAVRTAAGSIGEQVAILGGALRDEVIGQVVPLVEQFVARYEQRRRAEGVADFDDLLVWARDLLRNPEVRAYFQRKYPCVLVDEFQDTDPVQAELALLLTDLDGDGIPEPGRLVVVGDPKQSIYRFRRADIKIYDEIKFGPLRASTATIQQNFRSVNGVLDWVNRVFATVFADGEIGVQPAHVELLAARRSLGAAVTVVHGDGQATSADGIRVQEAERLAALLDQAVRVEKWIVEDRDTGVARVATWRDCVLLLPARTGIEHYIGALAARGIPHRAETRGAFFGTPEVAELTALLRAVDDPTDTLGIVATLRSRAFGISDDQLLGYNVAARGRIDYRGADAAEPKEVADALAILRDLHRQRRGLSLAELVRRATEAAGFVELALARGGGGAQAAGNILKVEDLARSFTVAGGGGLRAFTRWLDDQQDQEIGEAEASVSEESDDVVRLMTIHAAKGLEFPIVLLANLNSEAQRPGGPFADPVSSRIGFRVGTAKTGHFMTSDFDAWADEEKRLLLAEGMRLLYVALTRARDHLVLPLVPPLEKRKGMLRVVAEHLPELTDDTRGQVVGGVRVVDPEALPLAREVVAARAGNLTEEELADAERELEDWSAARQEALAVASAGLPVVTASSVRPLDRAFPLAASEDAGDQAIALDLAPPVDIGAAVHRVLELMPLSDVSGAAGLAGAVCAEAGIDSSISEVLDLVERCLRSPSVVRALAVDRYEREVPFSAVLEDGLHLVGRMDLVFREGDELVVVDFKTDDVSTAADMDAATVRHSGQAAAYAEATELATGMPVREVVFVYPRGGGERALARSELGSPSL